MNKINFLKSVVTVVAVALFFPVLHAEDKGKVSSVSFLKRVRTPPSRKTWAQLQGQIMNMKRNSEGKRIISKAPIYLAIRFSSEMIFAQVIINDNEMYSVGQSYSMLKNSATVLKGGDKSSSELRGTFGIRPEDLTMSFLFWDMVEELPSGSVGFIACRIFLLSSPDKSETAKVYISRDNYFPVKVEWSKPGGGKNFTDVVRTLEVVSFKEVNKLYLVKELKFYGPGWRTNIKFEDCKAGLVKDGTPKELFRDATGKNEGE